MRKRILAYYFGMLIIIIWSCGHAESTQDQKDTKKRTLQQKDGSVSLILDNAAFYKDGVNPSNNTAEWDFVISKPGRFKVWITSATKDTTDLKYANAVRISFLDDGLEVTPVCDKIISNSIDVNYPYFSVDSYMGSIYIAEPGEYNIQLISEKVIREKSQSGNAALSDGTKLMSVILTPMTN
jgi:hypothetical protein